MNNTNFTLIITCTLNEEQIENRKFRYGSIDKTTHTKLQKSENPCNKSKNVRKFKCLTIDNIQTIYIKTIIPFSHTKQWFLIF